MLTSVGPLSALDVQKPGGSFQGRVYCAYQDPALTDRAVTALSALRVSPVLTCDVGRPLMQSCCIHSQLLLAGFDKCTSLPPASDIQERRVLLCCTCCC